MQKKLLALALGALLCGGSLAAFAASQPTPDPQMTCCDGNGPCCDRPCCDRCPEKAAN